MTVKNLSAREAYEVLNTNDRTVLIDVRTENEWQLEGKPDVKDEDKRDKVKFITWLLLPSGIINPNFEEQLKAEVDFDKTLIFMCRSGVRSRQASEVANQLGYEYCYNITDGFAGNIDGIGWKSSGLPWRQ